jgi:hypothetical protein
MAGVMLNLSDKITHREAVANTHAILNNMDGDKVWSLEEVEALYDQHRLLNFKNPRKPRSSKVSSDSSERSEQEYNPNFCDARIWLKGGFAGQCSCKTSDGKSLCKRHQNEADKNNGKVKNGFFNGERPTHHYGDTSNKAIPWADLAISQESPESSDSSTKPKKPRVCSVCKCTGHNKRNCPTLKVCSPCSPTQTVSPPQPVQDLVEDLELDQDSEQAPDPVPEADPFPEEDPVSDPVPEADPVHEEDLVSDPVPEEEPVPDPVPEEELDSDDEDDEDEVTVIDCSYENVSYTRNPKNEVFDDDFTIVGEWVDGAIKFNGDGAIAHMNNPNRS